MQRVGNLLAGKVAFLTGAGAGIGKGVAQKFVSQGAKVVVADLNLGAARQVADELNASFGKNSALAVSCDVTKESEVNSSFEHALASYGRVDVLLNNAGLQHIAPLHELSLDAWRKMFAVHVDGAFLCTRAALQHMYKRSGTSAATSTDPNRGGCILFMGSVHSKTVSVLKAPYCAAKHALVALTRSVAKEGAPYGVRANLIAPGFVRTALVDKQIPEQAAKLGISEAEVIKNVMLKDTVDGEFTTVDDVAEVCLNLAAFKTNALTGQSVIVSHGWTME